MAAKFCQSFAVDAVGGFAYSCDCLSGYSSYGADVPHSQLAVGDGGSTCYFSALPFRLADWPVFGNGGAVLDQFQ